MKVGVDLKSDNLEYMTAILKQDYIYWPSGKAYAGDDVIEYSGDIFTNRDKKLPVLKINDAFDAKAGHLIRVDYCSDLECENILKTGFYEYSHPLYDIINVIKANMRSDE